MDKNLEILRKISWLILFFIYIINTIIEPKYTYLELIIITSIIIFAGAILFYIDLKNLKANNKENNQ